MFGGFGLALLLKEKPIKNDQKSNCLHTLGRPKNDANIQQDEEAGGAQGAAMEDNIDNIVGDDQTLQNGFNYGELGKYLNTRLRASARRE